MGNKIRLVLLSLIAISGCRTGAAPEMVFDDILCVRSFPQSYTLSRPEVLDISLPGMLDICLYDDSHLLVSAPTQDGLVSVYNLTDGSREFSCFNLGNGPGELLKTPFFASIGRKQDCLLMHDSRGHLLGWRKSGSDAEITVVIDSLPSLLYYAVYVNDSTALCRTIKPGGTGLKRFLYMNGENSVTSSMEKLNFASIPGGHPYLFNLMSSFVGYDSSRGIVVEASLLLNTINMYTLDGSFERTICLGKKPDSIEDLYHRGELFLTETFTRIRLFDDYFAVMYSGERDKRTFISARNPKIYFFNWDGTPRMEFKLHESAATFELDVNNGLLYTLDRDDELIRRYDVSEYIF